MFKVTNPKINGLLPGQGHGTHGFLCYSYLTFSSALDTMLWPLCPYLCHLEGGKGGEEHLAVL